MELLTLINAGPLFKFNPSVSFLVAFDSAEAVNAAWEKLSEGGVALMELGPYPFAERYGWIQDKYGLSWQLMFSNTQEEIDYYWGKLTAAPEAEQCG